jgi:hypothetical protein
MESMQHVCQHVFLPQTVENEALQYLSLSITAGELEANFPQQYDFGASPSSSPNNQGLHLQNLVPDFLFLFVRELPSRLVICWCALCIMTADGYMMNDVDLGRSIITEVQWSCHSQCSKHYATE